MVVDCILLLNDMFSLFAMYYLREYLRERIDHMIYEIKITCILYVVILTLDLYFQIDFS